VVNRKGSGGGSFVWVLMNKGFMYPMNSETSRGTLFPHAERGSREDAEGRKTPGRGGR